MDRNTEVRLWLADMECELRPLSAAERLAAIKEAENAVSKYGGGDEARAMLRGAFTAARGLYSGGEPVFSSGEEALGALTPEEIAEIYELYGEIRLPDTPENKESADKRSTAAESGAAYENMPQNNERERTPGEKYPAAPRKRPQNTAVGDTAAAGGESIYRSAFFAAHGASSRSSGDMESISDFFERDSRRYDGAFEIF